MKDNTTILASNPHCPCFPARPTHDEWEAEFNRELGLRSPSLVEALTPAPDCLARFTWAVAEWESAHARAKVLAFDSERWSYVVSREPTDHRQWRVTLFDALGPFSHHCYSHRLDAVLYAANDGGTPTPTPQHAA